VIERSKDTVISTLAASNVADELWKRSRERARVDDEIADFVCVGKIRTAEATDTDFQNTTIRPDSPS
jgi:hypothetical protein